MSVKEIELYPSEILLEKCYEVNFIDGNPGNVTATLYFDSPDEIKILIQDLMDTLLNRGGLGLAAPQISSNKQVIVFMDQKKNLGHLINPKIIARSGKVTSHSEGCLSCPETRKDIKRSRRVTVDGYYLKDNQLKDIRISFKHKLTSIVIQHEIDHLNGITIMEK
jgi:peptide deformylase